MIYKFIFQSPTGRFIFSYEDRSLHIDQLITTPRKRLLTLIPWAPILPISRGSNLWSGSPLDLSICYTCRQISSEARRVLWNQSEIVFNSNNFPRLVNIPLRISCKIQHIAFEVTAIRQIGANPWFFHHLQTLAENLKTLILLFPYRITRTIWRFSWCISRAAKVGSISSDHLAHLDILRHLRQTLSHVTRKIIVQIIGHRSQNASLFRKCEEVQLDPNLSIRELNIAFGGELLAREQLCYKDGVEILPLFPNWSGGGLGFEEATSHFRRK